MKIAVVGIIDGAKSGRCLAEAIARHTPHEVCYVNWDNSREDYARALIDADAVFVAGDSMIERGKDTINIYDQRKRKPYNKASGHTIKNSSVFISVPMGRNYRRKRSGYQAHEIWPLELYRMSFEMIVPTEPDLNYSEIDDGILPYAVDTELVPKIYNPPPGFIIAAYWTARDAKNVDKYIVPAINILKGEGIKIELKVYGQKCRVPHSQFMQERANCTVYYGQITPIGVYGRSEVEAMAMGIPTIVGITEEAKARAGSNTEYGSPCIKAYSCLDVVNTLRGIANNEYDLEAISRESREYAIKWHSYQSVARQAMEFVEEAIRRGKDEEWRHNMRKETFIYNSYKISTGKGWGAPQQWEPVKYINMKGKRLERI